MVNTIYAKVVCRKDMETLKSFGRLEVLLLSARDGNGPNIFRSVQLNRLYSYCLTSIQLASD